MNRIRSLGLVAALGAVVTLTGCVAGPGYYSDAGYSQPYYSDPSPVVVAPPIYIQGGGYYGGGSSYYREPYRQPYYDGRGRGGNGYYGGRPGYTAPRPGGGYVPGVGPGRPIQSQPAARAPQGVPRPFVVPPSARGPGAVVQPSWNNKEQP